MTDKSITDALEIWLFEAEYYNYMGKLCTAQWCIEQYWKWYGDFLRLQGPTG